MPCSSCLTSTVIQCHSCCTQTPNVQGPVQPPFLTLHLESLATCNCIESFWQLTHNMISNACCTGCCITLAVVACMQVPPPAGVWHPCGRTGFLHSDVVRTRAYTLDGHLRELEPALGVSCFYLVEPIGTSCVRTGSRHVKTAPRSTVWSQAG